MRAFIAFLLCLSPSVALADVVMNPPASCPPGSTPSTRHGGPHCRVNPCTSNADCSGGRVCGEIGLVLTQTFCGGRLPPDAAPPPAIVSTTGACVLGSAGCQSVRGCVLPGGVDAGSAISDAGALGDAGDGRTVSRYGCGCSAPGGTATPVVFGLALFGLGLTRRRR